MFIFLFLFVLSDIKIEYKDLFEKENFFYNLAERINFKTKKWRIRDLIIINDSINIKETLRRIKYTGIFSDINIERKNDTLVIKLRPLFTLALFLNLELKGGLVQKGIGIWEHNFLGLLWDIRLNYIWGYEYPYLNFYSFYPSIFKNHDFILYYENSEFSKIFNFYLKNYNSPVLKNRFNLFASIAKYRKFTYKKGFVEDTIFFRNRTFIFSFSKNILKNLKVFSPGIVLGYRENNYEDCNYAGISIEIGNYKTAETKFVKNFGEKEYFLEGLSFYFSTFYSLNNITGWEFIFKSSLFKKRISYILFIRYKEFLDRFFVSQITAYWKIKKWFVIALFLRREIIWNFFQDLNTRYIGGTNFLRGYPAFYFESSDYTIFIKEVRFFYDKEFFNFLKPGFTLFLEGIYNEDKKFYFSYGFGFRFELTRIYRVPLLKIDFGFSEKGVYLSFSQDQVF